MPTVLSLTHTTLSRKYAVLGIGSSRAISDEHVSTSTTDDCKKEICEEEDDEEVDGEEDDE